MNGFKGSSQKKSNHVLLVDNVKHAIRWAQGMDSIDLIAPYKWCRDYPQTEVL